jgi:GNAT superfamily N-acetyltransferase
MMQAAIRLATHTDVPAIERLIAASARALGAAYYREEQIEAALRGAFGVDTQLIDDRTYFLVDGDDGLAACGGWSFRRTLFGSDARSERDADVLDPLHDSARIRAFFVDPSYARRGLGRALLEHCEAQARLHGFRRFALMSTLPGVALYARCGYLPGAPLDHRLAEGLSIRFMPMQRDDVERDG